MNARLSSGVGSLVRNIQSCGCWDRLLQRSHEFRVHCARSATRTNRRDGVTSRKFLYEFVLSWKVMRHMTTILRRFLARKTFVIGRARATDDEVAEFSELKPRTQILF